jgi:hypothetical protein
MATLAASILLHAALGIGLAAFLWGVGLGYVLVLRGGRVDRPEAVDAYPLGLLVVVLAAMLFLVHAWLGVAAAALLVAPVPALLGARRSLAALRPALAPVLWGLPATAGFAGVLGYLLHGPSDDLDSRAFGDMFFYVNKLASAADSLVPFRDLLAEGQDIIYVEGAPSFVGAALSHLPGLDPVLFHTTTLPVVFLVSVGLGIALLADGTQPRPRPAAALGVLALLAVAMLPYPTWLTESPPLALSLPLTFSLYRLWADELMPLRWFVVLAAILAVDLMLTKVVAAMPLACVVAFALYRRYRTHPQARRVALLLGATLAVAGTLVAVLLFATASWYVRLFGLEFFPARAARDLWSQLETRSTQEAAPAFTVVGELLLLAAVVRARSWAFATALGTALAASWVLGHQAFDGAIGTANLLAALLFWRRPDLLRGQWPLVAAAALALAVSVWFREIYGVRAGLLLLLLCAFALLPALAGRERRPVERRARQAAVVLTGAVAALVAAVVPSDLRLSEARVTLTSADHDIWERVADVVPDEGLVFTTMTGRDVGPRTGWNNYPSIAGRQLYLAGWYDGRLTTRREEVDRRLALNREVLSGDLSPAELELSRRYDSHFAVARRSERLPDSFQLVYGNGAFALYRIPVS